MRIAVDARPLEAQRTGVGRYLEGILEAWKRLYPSDRFVLVSCRPVFLPPALDGWAEVDPERSRLPGTLWLQARAPGRAARLRADLFFGPLGVLPLAGRLPGVATVHDLTPILFPAWHDRRNRLGFAPFLGPTVRVARAVATVSEATLSDLLRRYPEARGKAVAIPNGVAPPPAGPLPPPAGLPEGRPYVLFLGTIEPRKNLPRLVAACETVWRRRPAFPDLVLAGGMGWGSDEFPRLLAASPFRDRIRRLGYVTPEEAPRLLSHARLLAYPSLYEGFGLPPLEAMALGVPVVASSSSSLPEVVGDAGLLPDPTDVEAIAAALETADADEGFRARARERGPARARLFTWDEAARRTRALFEKALA